MMNLNASLTHRMHPANKAGFNTQLLDHCAAKDQLAFTKSYTDGSEMAAGMIHLPRYDFIYFYKVRGRQDPSYPMEDDDLALLENRMLALATDFIYMIFQTIERPYQKAMSLLDHLHSFVDDSDEKGG